MRAISFSQSKIASERRCSLRLKGTKLMPTAEFSAIPESAVKIDSAWQCAMFWCTQDQAGICASSPALFLSDLPPTRNAERSDGNQRATQTIFQPASWLEKLLEGLLRKFGGVWAEASGRGPRLLRSCLGVELRNPKFASEPPQTRINSRSVSGIANFKRD